MSIPRLLSFAGCLFIASAAFAAPGDRIRLGRAGDWKAAQAAAALDGWLYTAESTGGLYVTDPGEGVWRQVGRPEFGDLQALFALGGMLFGVDGAGTLCSVRPRDGRRLQLGPTGAWADAVAGVVHRDRLYGVLDTGVLAEADRTTGARIPTGTGGLPEARLLVSTGDHVLAIEEDGDLVRFRPGEPRPVRIGPPGGWQGTVAATFLGGRLWTTERGGGLVSTDPVDGARRAVGEPVFGDVWLLVTAGEGLRAIDTDGILWSIETR
ncbi:MAG: hypothetical protein FJ098_06940 [Deltaproteobacteria bacterium]|nr:hypothetical protein [Deltaproteobacteria bacterium]